MSKQRPTAHSILPPIMIPLPSGGGSGGGGTTAWNDITGKPTEFNPSAHAHAVTDVTGLQTALNAKADASTTATALSGKANSTHSHVPGDITDLAEWIQDMIAGFLVAGANVALTYNDAANQLTIAATAPTGSVDWASVTGKPSTFAPSAHTHGIVDVTGLQTALDGKSATTHAHNLVDLNGNLTAARISDFVASVDARVALVINGAPAALDTLQELAAALGNDANFSTTISTALGNRVRVDAVQSLTSPQQAQARSNIGLGNVDNTSDAGKPISTATQTALNLKLDATHAGTGGTAHANATTSVAGFMSSADKAKLDGVATSANNYVHPNHTGDVTSTGDGATTIANNAVTTAKIADANVTGAKLATLVAGDASKLQAPVRAIMEIVGTQSGAIIDETLGRIQSRTLSADVTLAGTGHTISDGNVISLTVLASGASRNLVFPATMDSRNVRANALTITTASGKYRTISIMRIGSDIHVDAGAEK